MENITARTWPKRSVIADSGLRRMVQHTPRTRSRRVGPLFCTNPSMARHSQTRIKSPANTNVWRMGPHFSQVETTLTATKSELERCQHDLGRPEGEAVIDSVARGAWRRKLTNMSCRFSFAPTRPESIDITPCSPRRAILPDAGRAEEARYCGNNGQT